MEQEKQKENHSYTGLTASEVEERIRRGLVNGDLDVKTKSYRQILKDNSLTLFNLINVVLLVCILLSGSLKNALFFLIVLWNFGIGTFQEIRAKKTIEKLSLISAPKAYVLRDGEVRELQIRDIVLNDILQLKSGNQVCADSVVLEGSCQVNESLVTGESVPIYKTVGDHLLSGSFLVSGQVLAETEHIGADNYVNQITLGAKYYKKPDSVIMTSVRSIVRIITFCLIPMAGLLVWNNFFRTGLEFSPAMVKTVAAVSSMIPGGLVLLVSIVLAVSVIRLSVHKTLVQDLYSVENLARVDTLLLDKTGTITEGVMQVEDVLPLQTDDSSQRTEMRLSFFMKHISDENATAAAIREYTRNVAPLSDTTAAGSVYTIPFSSDRKWSLVSAEGVGTMVLGAPDYILPDCVPDRSVSDSGNLQPDSASDGLFDDLKHRIREIAETGKRVVFFAYTERPVTENPEGDHPGEPVMRLPGHLIPAALIVIGDRIRSSAPDTFRYFEREGVQIKVISGDSPVTVSMVAQKAGLKHADQWVDASELKGEDDIRDAVEQYTVFGRVTPQQKLQITRALKQQGHVVAMTGDGANDVLALKEADCSIAMQAGADAAKNVANMVLLDSDFSSLPLVVAEGRKSINNLQRSAALYLTKTVYAFLFSILFFILTSVLYPFENIQVTLIGAVTIGLPSFLLALEPNEQRIRHHFLRNVFLSAVPSGVLEAAALIVLLLTLKGAGYTDTARMSCASVFLMMICGIIVVFNVAGKLNLLKLGMILLLILLAFGAVMVLPGLFSIVPIPWEIWRIVLLISGVFFVIHTLIVRLVLPRFR